MKARKFPTTDYKLKKSRWDHAYKNLNFDQYIQTLNYDETTLFLKKIFSDKSRSAAILDVGCGPGRHVHWLCEQGFENITGVDLSAEGLKIINEHHPDVKTLVADATALPYSDCSFDVVLMVGIVYEIPDAKSHAKVFSEISRVLKPSGTFVFVNNSPYNFGEKVFTFTQRLVQVIKPQKYQFYNWRMERSDVANLLKASRLALTEEYPCNINRGVFRFHYGIFANKKAVMGRRKNLLSGSANTYSLHEYYLVQKNPELLNAVGRMLARLSKKHFPYLFANTVCYAGQKENQ